LGCAGCNWTRRPPLPPSRVARIGTKRNASILCGAGCQPRCGAGCQPALHPEGGAGTMRSTIPPHFGRLRGPGREDRPARVAAGWQPAPRPQTGDESPHSKTQAAANPRAPTCGGRNRPNSPL
jgi:hypothetical protein